MIGIFLDLETNGLDPTKHSVVEVALSLVDLDSGKVLESYQSTVQHSRTVWEASDPTSLQINGLTWERLQKGEPMERISERVKELFDEWEIRRGRAVYICQNPAFDRSFFSQVVSVGEQEGRQWPYHWLDLASMYWAYVVEQKRERGEKIGALSLSKDEIAKEFGLPEEEHPHTAENGVSHLVTCYERVVGFLGS